MRRIIIDSEFLKSTYLIHEQNQLLINCIQEQEEKINAMKDEIRELKNEVSKYEQESLKLMLEVVSANETTALIGNESNHKKCCVIL